MHLEIGLMHLGDAKEFVEEESRQVAELKRWMQLHLSGQALPTEG